MINYMIFSSMNDFKNTEEWNKIAQRNIEYF